MSPHRRIDVVFDSIKRLQRLGATANLLNLLQKQHPADLAEVLGELSDIDRRSIFNTLLGANSRLAMEALSEFDSDIGAALLAEYPADELGRLFQQIPSDDAAALIGSLPEELSVSVLESMRHQKSGEVQHLLEYSDQTAGRIMNPNVFAVNEELTVGQAIKSLQGSREVEMVFYLYVVNQDRHLIGVVSLRRLLLVSPETPLTRIMTRDLITARVDMDQEEVAQLVASYNLLAIPVIDEVNSLVGIITVDDVIDVIKDEATEDIYRMAGVSGDEHVFSSVRESIRKRFPWLGMNLITAMLAALVVRSFQSTINEVVALAAFMTIVASMGGNAATQTLTVIVRGIAIGELTWSNSRKALGKEALVGLSNGIILGIAGAGVAWLVVGNFYFGSILALAMIINLIVAAVAATLIPIMLRALNIDPALASSVFITTLTDMFGFFAFLGLATIFLQYL